MVSASEAAELGSIDFYSDSPWLIRGNMPWLQPLFASSDSVTLKAGTETLLGAERSVFLIEQGLIATFAVCESFPERMTALFGVGAVLGGFMAVLHPDKTKPLTARVLTDTVLRPLSADTFRTFLADDLTIENRTVTALLAQHECAMEGLLLNSLLPVPLRTARLIETLYRAAGQNLNDELTELPYPVTVSELAAMAHAARAVVSRTLSSWIDAGVCRKTGRHLWFTRGILGSGFA